MTTPLLIGLTGKKRSGKDTVAQAMIAAHGFTRFAFADALKQIALELDPIVHGSTHAQVFRLSDVVAECGWEDAKNIAEVRGTLQRLGVAVRGVDPDFWVTQVLVRARQCPTPVVVTDVRFPNEADAIESQGGFLVRVNRPGLPQGTAATDTHISETALDGHPVAATVDNCGSLDDLTSAVSSMVAHLSSPQAGMVTARQDGSTIFRPEPMRFGPDVSTLITTGA